jgi:hypothetical protein
MWASLEDFESSHSSGTSGSLVGDHASDALPCNLGWGLVVPWTTSERVGILLSVESPFSEESIQSSGDDDSLSSDDNDSLAVQKLLGNDSSESAKNVVLTVDDNNFFKHDYALLLFAVLDILIMESDQSKLALENILNLRSRDENLVLNSLRHLPKIVDLLGIERTHQELLPFMQYLLSDTAAIISTTLSSLLNLNVDLSSRVS